MSRHSLREQLRSGFPGGSMTLNQLWVLQEIGAGRMPESADPEQKRRDHRKMIQAIDRLQKALNVTLLRAHSSPGASPAELLTPEGVELIDIVGRFFDDLDAFGQSHTHHGPNVRLASSTTLLHWLVLPSIREIQSRAADFGEPRQPEISFQQVEIDEVANGLSSHLFQYAVVREAPGLDVSLVAPEAGQSLEQTLGSWAAWSDDEFARFHKEAGTSWWGGAAHGHRRIAWVLGQYDYVLCMRQDFYNRIVESSRLAGRNWRQDLPVALCTNHRKFANELRHLERNGGLRVAIRTDTWVESAQLALYGDFATIVPSIALHVHPELEPFTMQGLNLPSERVLMVLNPSILHTRTHRQMLCATAVGLSEALQRAAAKPG